MAVQDLSSMPSTSETLQKLRRGGAFAENNSFMVGSIGTSQQTAGHAMRLVLRMFSISCCSPVVSITDLTSRTGQRGKRMGCKDSHVYECRVLSAWLVVSRSFVREETCRRGGHLIRSSVSRSGIYDTNPNNHTEHTSPSRT